MVNYLVLFLANKKLPLSISDFINNIHNFFQISCSGFRYGPYHIVQFLIKKIYFEISFNFFLQRDNLNLVYFSKTTGGSDGKTRIKMEEVFSDV